MSRPVFIGAVIGGAVVVVAVLAWLVMGSINAHNQWVAWCASQQGHVIDDTDTYTGVGYAMPVGKNPGGVVVTTTSNTDYYCLSATGAILDIR